MDKKLCALMIGVFSVPAAVALEGEELQEIQPEQYFTMDSVIGAISDGAGSAIKSGVKSALKNAIFGPSGPNYVELSQASLDKIEDIVSSGFDTAQRENMIGNLGAFTENMSIYHDSILVGSPDSTLRSLITRDSSDLINHEAFLIIISITASLQNNILCLLQWIMQFWQTVFIMVFQVLII